MRFIKRVAASLAAAAAMIVGGAGIATADADPTHHHHHHGLIGDIIVFAPIDIDIVDNAIAVLGVASYDD